MSSPGVIQIITVYRCTDGTWETEETLLSSPGVIQVITVYRWTDGTWDVISATKPGGDYSQETLTQSADTDAVKEFISNEIDKEEH